MTPRRLAGLSLAGLVAIAGCGGGDRTTPAPAPERAAPEHPSRPNILLLTLDTTRQDHLGAYGATTGATPRLDRVAAEGLACDNAIATVPVTLPSHASILTGMWPPRHGVRDNADFRLPASETTLAEHLKDRGYATGAVMGSYVLAGFLGLQQGFDAYDDVKTQVRQAPEGAKIRFAPILERGATEVTDTAIAMLDRFPGRPVFQWVHYYDPHSEYDPPEPFATRFRDRPYDGEIAYMDAEIGRLLDAYDKRAMLDDTLVVVVADHGESLGEHGEDTHGILVYDATIKVPLLMRWPAAIRPGTRHAGLVSTVDLVPTILDLAGLPPLRSAQGTSFAAAAGGGAVPPRDPVYAEATYAERVFGWSPLFALRGVDRKFIDAPRPEWYDLAADPGETRNLAAARPDAAQDDRRRLAAMVQGFGAPETSADATMTPEQRANLESLGYLSGTAKGSTRRSRPDPKDLVGVANKFLRAKSMVAQGSAREIETLLGEVLAADPDNPAALSLLGTIRASRAGGAQGIPQLEAAVKAAPAVYETRWNLGNAYHLAGRFADAAKAFRAAIALQPGSGEAHFALGNALFAARDARGAVEAYARAIDLGYALPPVRAAYGTALEATGDPKGAEAALRAAVAGDPGMADAWNRLGLVVEKSGRRDEARLLYGKALEVRPDHPDALFNRAKVALLARDAASARRDLEALAGVKPGYPGRLFLWANLLAAEGDREGAKRALIEVIENPKEEEKIRDAARRMLAGLGI